MVQYKRKVLGFGLAATGFFIIALLVACAAIGGNGGLAEDCIADLSGREGGSGDELSASTVTSFINYQGRLSDSAGNPLNGTYTVAVSPCCCVGRGTLYQRLVQYSDTLRCQLL
jgi:hypothetical protein